jgi:hypothetical protein
VGVSIGLLSVNISAFVTNVLVLRINERQIVSNQRIKGIKHIMSLPKVSESG